jgi:HAMP domain-containing protein
VKPLKRSLRGTFTMVVVVAYAAVTVGAFFAFRIGAAAISDRFAARFASSQSQLEKNKILSLVDRELALSLKLADDPSIRAWMEDEGAPERWGSAYAQLESYRRFLRDGAYFVAVRSSGNYYARTPSTTAILTTKLSPSAPGDRWFYRTLQQDADYSLNVDHNAMLGENRVWINVLVRDAEGTAIGVAGCGMDLTAFLRALVDREEDGVSTIIVDKDGFLLAHRDRRFVDYNAQVERDSDKVSIYESMPDEADRAALRELLEILAAGQEPPRPITLEIGGQTLLCAAGSMAELGWYNLVLVDVDRVIDPADFIPIALSAFLSLLLVLAVVVVAVERLVLKPIAALSRAAGIVAAGAYDVSVPADSAGEIGELSAAFNAMAAKVREYTAGLETKVAERTAELSEANRSIMDSIRYARLIQNAVRPNRAETERRLRDYLAIDRPRDLVGGDFVFFAPLPADRGGGFALALADCTGHGVPGAMMAMMAEAHLRRAVSDCGDAGPAELIGRLHALVRETLGRSGGTEHFDNGLDIGLCRYRPTEDVLEFAGAGISLVAVRDGIAEEIPGGRGGVGYLSAPRAVEAGERRIGAASAATFYLASDGVLDLSGGERGFGFGRARLLRTLEAAHRREAPEREAFIAAALDEYAGNGRQRDDLTLVGFSPRIGGNE